MADEPKLGENRGNAGKGRPKGSRNRRTMEAVAAAQDGLSPLDYLLSVVRDLAADEGKRIDAAKAAAPYVHAKLQPVDKDGDTTQKTLARVENVIVDPASPGS